MISVVDMCMGSGKAQPLDCGVLTESGYIRMGDIRVGMNVFGEDGELHRVVGVFPQGVKRVYKITLSDGTSTKSCGEHLWTYQTPRDRCSGKYHTDTLDHISAKGLYSQTKRGHKNWQFFLPVTKPINFRHADVPLDPYIVGALLGDGCTIDSGVTFSNMECDVISKVADRLGDIATIKKHSGMKPCEHAVVGKERGKDGFGIFANILRSIGMLGKHSYDKSVPQEYLDGDVEQRLELIRGLMDTDGTVSPDGKYSFSTTSYQLARDMQYLIESVGGTATVGEKAHPFYIRNGDRVYCRKCYVLYIKVPDDIRIVSSEKHLARINAVRHTGVCRSIRSIEYCGDEECQCILVDSDSHLYITDNFIVTHNTSSAITYMNEHPEERFLYVTPFLDETERVVNACRDLDFAAPSNRIPEYGHAKRNHLRALVKQHRNVSLTHALFLMIDDVTAKTITDNGYTIIIDEVIDVFEPMRQSEQDLDMLQASGYLELVKGDTFSEYYHPSQKADAYRGIFEEFFQKAQYGQIVRTQGWEAGKRVRYGFWQVNRVLFTLAEKIYILTYLFDGMPMKGFLESNGLSYQYLGTRKCEDGKYRFCERGETPAYVEHLRDMVHVCEKSSINSIGNEKHALSASWCKAAEKDGRLARLSSHIQTFFRRHVPQEIGSDQRLWCTYKAAKEDVRGKGFANSFLVFNSKATNTYADRAALAYCVNVFPNPNMQSYLRHIGVEMDWDKYAVANMVQWIWRSRIRNGQEIWLYIPSRRMRTLFMNWMADAEAAYRKEHEVIE